MSRSKPLIHMDNHAREIESTIAAAIADIKQETGLEITQVRVDIDYEIGEEWVAPPVLVSFGWQTSFDTEFWRGS